MGSVRPALNGCVHGGASGSRLSGSAAVSPPPRLRAHSRRHAGEWNRGSSSVAYGIEFKPG